MRRTRLSLAAALAVATSVGLVAAPAVADAAPKNSGPKDVTVQLLAMNDFHGRITPQLPTDGQLLTSPGKDGVYGRVDPVTKLNDDESIEVGGAAHIAATVDRLQAEFKNGTQGPSTSLFVGAGDLVSATPFESSVYKDEPTIEALNAMGLDVSSVGNHEFDRGTEELRRISAATDGTFSDDVTACEGITVGVDGCFGNGDGHDFHGADFPYLAANVVMAGTEEPMLPPYQVFDTPANQKVALIGVVTEDTPNIVTPGGVADVDFIDEAEAVNRWVPVLQAQGVEAIGVLVHEGGTTKDANVRDDINKCTGLTGPIVDINNRVDNAVDLIVSAHTHTQYNCLLPVPNGEDRLVTQAGFYGRLLTDIRLSIDRTTGDVNREGTYQATNVPVTREATDAEVKSIVDYWNARADITGNVPVGKVTRDVLAPSGSSQRHLEWPLVNLIADAQLYAMTLITAADDPVAGEPEIGFMNPGGVRTSITYGADGVVTFREAFNVQPFSNTVNAVNLSGAEIKQVLEQQFAAPAPAPGEPPLGRTTRLVLGVAGGLTYTYDDALPYGSKIAPCSLMLDGVPLSPTEEYRVVANSFLAGGGDGFTAFRSASNPYVGPMDVDTSLTYFDAFSPVEPPALGRFPASTAWTC